MEVVNIKWLIKWLTLNGASQLQRQKNLRKKRGKKHIGSDIYI